MAALNKATLIGNLGKDPKVTVANNGNRIVTFSLATTEKWKDKATGEARERTQWHQIVIFNENIGRIAETYLKKGSQAYLEGAIETRKYTDQTGGDRYVTEIVLRNFEGKLVLLGGGEDRRPTLSPDDYGVAKARSDAGAAERRPASGDPNDEIPF